jgi:hypothetical protein
MAWIDGKAFWFFLPALTDVFIRGKPSEGFEALGEIVGHPEGVEVLFEVLRRLVRAFFDRGFFEGAVYALDLAIGPGVIGVGEAVPHARLLADAVENMRAGILIAFAVGELETVIGEHRRDLLRYGGNQVA